MSTESIIKEICQIRARHGFPMGREDLQTQGQLTDAAMCYAYAGDLLQHGEARGLFRHTWPWKYLQVFWPWKDSAFVARTTARDNYLHAAAWLIAEAERIDRAKATSDKKHGEPIAV
jgi:hypothetical protein